eukprot:SAG11_NODE_2656_length_3121_cov_2.233212_2_plen_100_part_00
MGTGPGAAGATDAATNAPPASAAAESSAECVSLPKLDAHIWIYPRLVVQRTCLMCGLNFLIMVALVAIPVALNHTTLTKETSFDWVISSEEASICAPHP